MPPLLTSQLTLDPDYIKAYVFGSGTKLRMRSSQTTKKLTQHKTLHETVKLFPLMKMDVFQ